MEQSNRPAPTNAMGYMCRVRRWQAACIDRALRGFWGWRQPSVGRAPHHARFVESRYTETVNGKIKAEHRY